MALSIAHTQLPEASPSIDGELLIAVEDLSLSYGSGKRNKQVLGHINLEIREQEFVAVLGSSGCGKTSLLRILAGYEQLSAGRINVLGKDRVSPNADVGVVFQHANLFPWLSVQNNVQFGLKMKRLPKPQREEIASEIIAQVGLAPFAHYLPYQLSGGMKQRAAIARTLAADPRIMLMDEPFGALDAITRENLQSMLKLIWKNSRRTVFFITHDVDEALFLGTRIIVMNGSPGRIGTDIANPIFEDGGSIASLRKNKEYSFLRESLLERM
ncbi:ABC transporter ATP-binding protein [Cohnella abietis]|uniref:Nitrate ABC transporter ATP-binding protein n=1 Tax=Cohnella abietis TaxID=2507935 RepID=A0A3T1D2T8_9BACL|nr:ABC transporter ATP-binding protein [Cohnella abietis]BBI32404.1 nitrate ABC transporter ATP-binding protein [Cohnella abietis]